VVSFTPKRFYSLGKELLVPVEGLGGRRACPTIFKLREKKPNNFTCPTYVK